MARIVTASLLCLLCLAAPAMANHDLFISEYIEGSSNNKALEIYNPTALPIDLTAGGYLVEIYFNGAITPASSIPLTGVLASGDVFVVAHASANAAILAVADIAPGTLLQFNGDDAVVLRKGGTGGPVLDVIGQVGFDPGAEWGAGLQSTADNTLQRKATSCEGDVLVDDAFVPSLDYDGFATDTFSGLGSHPTPPCAPTGVKPSTWGAIKILYR